MTYVFIKTNETSLPNEEKLAVGTPIMQKTKAMAIKEAVFIADSLGLTEGFVKNIVIETGCKQRIDGCVKFVQYEKPYYKVTQSWYIFKEDKRWYFKMNEKTKTSHEVIF